MCPFLTKSLKSDKQKKKSAEENFWDQEGKMCLRGLCCKRNGPRAEARKMKTCALRTVTGSRIHLLLKKEKESESI